MTKKARIEKLEKDLAVAIERIQVLEATRFVYIPPYQVPVPNPYAPIHGVLPKIQEAIHDIHG